MKLIKQLLSGAWIDQQIQQLASERGDMEALLTKRLLGSIGANDWEGACGTEIRTRMRMCELQYVRGAPSDDVRGLCRETVESLLPKISELDFSKRVVRVKGGMLRSHAKRLVETHGGKWWKDGQYYAGAEWSEMQQPLALDILRLWLMAAVAGSQELAARLASAYEVPNADLLRSGENG